MHDHDLSAAMTPTDDAARESAHESGTETALLPPPAQESKRRRGGAPEGNRNSLRHGLRAGRLPPGCSWIAASTAELRTALENAVLAARGEISITDAAAINTATRAERHALLCQKLLRDKWDFLNHEQRLSYSREIVTASAARDKAIDRLALPKSGATDFTSHYSTIEADAPPADDEYAHPLKSPEKPATASDAETAEDATQPQNAAPCFSEKLPAPTEAA